MSTIQLTSGQNSLVATGPAADRLADALIALLFVGGICALLHE